MATIDAPDFLMKVQHQHAFGNVLEAEFVMSKASALGDIYRFGIIKKGTRIAPHSLKVRAADHDALVTMKFGLQKLNTSDAFTTDDDYFMAAKAIHTGPTFYGEADCNVATAAQTLAEDVVLIGTTAGAAQATAAEIRCFIRGVFEGLE
jgi:hypothetical protein